MPGFSSDINASRAEARKLLQEAGAENLTFTLTNRNVAMPYTPVGVFLIDQWRQIGVTVQARAARDPALPRRAAARQPDLRCRARLQLRLHGRAQPAAAEVPLARPSTINYAEQTDRELDDALRQAGGRARQEEAHRHPARVRARAARAGLHVIPTIWWHRIIVHHKQMKGWHITPSHYVGQDLADVWLDQ